MSSSMKLSVTNSNNFADDGLERPYYFQICASLLADQVLMCVSRNQKKHTALKTDDCYCFCLASSGLTYKEGQKESSLGCQYNQYVVFRRWPLLAPPPLTLLQPFQLPCISNIVMSFGTALHISICHHNKTRRISSSK